MPRYEYRSKSFDRDDGTVDLPDDAVGVTISTFAGKVYARYLAPVAAADGGYSCRYHPDAGTTSVDIRVTDPDAPDRVHEGVVCAECDVVLAVGEYKHDVDGDSDESIQYP